MLSRLSWASLPVSSPDCPCDNPLAKRISYKLSPFRAESMTFLLVVFDWPLRSDFNRLLGKVQIIGRKLDNQYTISPTPPFPTPNLVVQVNIRFSRYILPVLNFNAHLVLVHLGRIVLSKV